MEQKMWFWLELGWLAVLKKNFGPILRAFFSCFHEKKMLKNFVVSALKSCIKSLLQIFFWIFFWFFLKLFLAQNRLNIHNQLCIALLETPPCATLAITTWLIGWKTVTDQRYDCVNSYFGMVQSVGGENTYLLLLMW